jgi:hypothetical protein
MRREPPKPSPDAAAIGRLALRGEGPDWNAYYAMPHTMEGALPLGSIKMAIVTANPTLKQAFMALMRDVDAAMIKDGTGISPTWGNPETAPERERSGNA